MTAEEFIRSVNNGCLIDYDGIGEYSDGKQVSNIKVKPSAVKKNGLDKRFSHVVWYNK